MYKITTEGFKELSGYTEALARDQLPFAAMLTLNDLGFMVRDELMQVVARVFDRPKPQTVRNFWVSKATKTRLSVFIEFRQMYEKTYGEYMVPQVEGGPREMKGSEAALKSYFHPGVGAKIDPYGNMQRGQITQILSQLQAFAEGQGWDMNRNLKSKYHSNISKKKGIRSGSKATEYFLVRQKQGGLAPGVYQRTEKRNGFTSTGAPSTSRTLPRGAFQRGRSSSTRARGAVPVMVFTPKAPMYKKRFPFYETANKVVTTNLQPVFSKRVAQALATARR